MQGSNGDKRKQWIKALLANDQGETSTLMEKLESTAVRAAQMVL